MADRSQDDEKTPMRQPDRQVLVELYSSYPGSHRAPPPDRPDATQQTSDWSTAPIIPSQGDGRRSPQKSNYGSMNGAIMPGLDSKYSSQQHLLTGMSGSNKHFEGDEAPWKLQVKNFSSKKQLDLRNKSKRVRSYYLAQNELISAYEDMAQDMEHSVHIVENNESNDKAVLFSKITLAVNVLLLVAKAVASILSGSISIISSLVDTCLDLFSGSIMWWASRAVRKRDPYAYPQGRTKLEPASIIILSVVMAFCSIMIIRESITMIMNLASDSSSMPVVDAVTFAISGSVVVIKCVLWLVCRRVNSPIVKALAQDHRNDVFSNAIAILCGYLGSSNFMEISNIYEFGYADPGGAIFISLYIIFNWWQTGTEQLKMLTGKTAGPEFISKLTWICLNHHPDIQYLETVRAFHFGSNFMVEVDIVLPEEMLLKDAHHIGESLQQRLESLPEVERAFVHVDYNFTHHPHSEHKVV